MPNEDIDILFGWEDSEVAGIQKFICSCGKDLSYHGTVGHGSIIECEDCHRRYEFTWRGMQVKELTSET